MTAIVFTVCIPAYFDGHDPTACSLYILIIVPPLHIICPTRLFYFSETDQGIAEAKALCGTCPVRNKCLEGALSRQEPCGVWGGQLLEDGVIIERKRRAGRPPRQVIAAARLMEGATA